MQKTYETRVPVTGDQAALLAEQCEQWSAGLRKAWRLCNNLHLSESEMHYSLMPLGFTSHQVKSLIATSTGRHKALKELKKYEQKQLKASISKRKAALKRKTQRLAKLHTTKKPTKLTLLDITFVEQWIAQKEQALQRSLHKQVKLERQLKLDQFAMVFGGKTLLSQRPTELNHETSPFDSAKAWRAEWLASRNHQIWSVGAKSKPQGNQEIQWFPDTKILRIRLTDTLAKRRMRELEAKTGLAVLAGGSATGKYRVQSRFLEIPNVDFTARGTEAYAALVQAVTSQPVTMRLVHRKAPTGEDAFYLQASVSVADAPITVTRTTGVLGMDFNVRGVAWSVVKPDGNSKETGFVSWAMAGKSTEQRDAILSNAGTALLGIARKHRVALAIEDLDFANKKTAAKAGTVDRDYNRMLGEMATSQFKELLTSKAAKTGVALHLVSPAYSSVGGFVKFGRFNRIDADRAAAIWLGRQALYGDVSRVNGVVHHVDEFKERLSMPHLPVHRKRSKKALADATWHVVAQAMGWDRRNWGKNLDVWLNGVVDVALQSEQLNQVFGTEYLDMGNIHQARENKTPVPALLM